MPRLEINSRVCKACELCVAACKKEVLALGKESNAGGYHFVTVVHPENCVACKMCAIVCPDSCIEIWKEKTAADQRMSGTISGREEVGNSSGHQVFGEELQNFTQEGEVWNVYL